MSVVIGDVLQDLAGQIFQREEIPTPQYAPAQHPKPDLDLIQPTAVFRREVDHMPRTTSGQEGPPLLPCPQPQTLVPTTRIDGQIAAQLERPMRVQVVHHPVEPLYLREHLHHVPDVTHKIPTP